MVALRPVLEGPGRAARRDLRQGVLEHRPSRPARRPAPTPDVAAHQIQLSRGTAPSCKRQHRAHHSRDTPRLLADPTRPSDAEPATQPRARSHASIHDSAGDHLTAPGAAPTSRVRPRRNDPALRAPRKSKSGLLGPGANVTGSSCSSSAPARRESAQPDHVAVHHGDDRPCSRRGQPPARRAPSPPRE